MTKLCDVAIAGCLAATFGGASALHAAPAPEGVLRWIGTGVQVYDCKRNGDRAAWTLQRPDAALTDAAGQAEGHHGAGPSWKSTDGSVVYGTVMVSMPSPVAGSVPWLVLRASKHEGSGQMSNIVYVLRTNTEGGAAPATGCDPAHDGAETRVAYHATYTFLVEPGNPAEPG